MSYITSFTAKKSRKGKQPVPRGPCGELFEKDPAKRARKRSNRRQGIFLKVTELNKITADHAYLELYKRDERPGFEHKADFLTKKVACTSKDLLLLNKDTSTSNKDKSFREESSLTAEQVKTFETRSKRQRQTYLKKAIEKKVSKPNQLCQVCNQSTNIPWIGCDYEWANGKICEYWVHALCLGFPDAEGETFENISFHCPPHNRANIVSASSKKKKSSSFWKS